MSPPRASLASLELVFSSIGRAASAGLFRSVSLALVPVVLATKASRRPEERTLPGNSRKHIDQASCSPVSIVLGVREESWFLVVMYFGMILVTSLVNHL